MKFACFLNNIVAGFGIFSSNVSKSLYLLCSFNKFYFDFIYFTFNFLDLVSQDANLNSLGSFPVYPIL